MSARRVPHSLVVTIVVLIGLALVGAAAGPVTAQTVPGQEAGIVATGYGRASGPATSAAVQLIVSRDVYGYGPVEAMPSGMEESREETVVVDASPVAGEAGFTEFGPGMSTPEPLAEEDVAPIVDAVVAAGVAEDQITLTIPAVFSAYSGPGGPDNAQIRFSVANPVVDDLVAIARAAQQAARDAGLSLQHVGVRYLGENCDALEQQAREQAIAAARARAEGMAQALGVELGDLVQATDGGGFFGPYGAGDPADCTSQLPYEVGYGPGVDNPFDPTQPAEVVIFASVTLTFAMGTGTPTPGA